MVLVILLLLTFFAGTPASAQTCPPRRTALVLSGGGAKGLAHIGLLRVLDSLGIRPDLVVGSSMGAIIGAMYASGYTGHQIDSLARALPIADLFRVYQPRAPRSLGLLQPLVMWEQGERHFNLQSAAVEEAEVNALVNAATLKGNLIARGNFDSLPIPFRAVATDLSNRSTVVLGSGDLAQAVRASFAIPLVFAPESVGGRVLADGGLTANIPVTVARQEGATQLIVSDATERPSNSLDLYSPIVLADRLLGFLFEQSGDSLRSGDILIRPDVQGFTGLNFSPANVDRLIRRGTAAADTVLPRFSCLPKRPVPHTPSGPTHIADVRIESSNASERLSLSRTLGLGLSDSLNTTLLRSRVRHLGRSEDYESVWLSPGGSSDSVSFSVVVRRAPRRVAGLGLAYDNELGGRMWVGAVDRRLLDLALEGSTAVFLGDFRKEIYLGFRRNYQLGRQLMTPTITANLASESIRQFDPSGDELASLKTRKAQGFGGIEWAAGQDWEFALGAAGYAWREPRRERSTLGVVGKVIRASRARERSLEASLLWTALFRRTAFEANANLHLGKLRLRPRVRLGWGQRLPLQETFQLGGEDGFPGLHIGERRGDREAMVGLLATYALRGPFVGRIEVAAGRAAIGGTLLGDEEWLVGARAGIGANTPVGPVRFEYGVASGGRSAVFVRLGRWF
jgi:NTE family protein